MISPRDEFHLGMTFISSRDDFHLGVWLFTCKCLPRDYLIPVLKTGMKSSRGEITHVNTSKQGLKEKFFKLN